MVIGVVLLGTAIAIENVGIFSGITSVGLDKKAEQQIDTERIAFEIHAEVNKVRELHGLESLSWSSAISEIAEKHSQDMNDRNYLDHISPEGHDVVDRYKEGNFVCKKENTEWRHFERR